MEGRPSRQHPSCSLVVQRRKGFKQGMTDCPEPIAKPILCCSSPGPEDAGPGTPEPLGGSKMVRRYLSACIFRFTCRALHLLSSLATAHFIAVYYHFTWCIFFLGAARSERVLPPPPKTQGVLTATSGASRPGNFRIPAGAEHHQIASARVLKTPVSSIGARRAFRCFCPQLSAFGSRTHRAYPSCAASWTRL